MAVNAEISSEALVWLYESLESIFINKRKRGEEKERKGRRKARNDLL